jgi:tRNA (guanine-N7-)-methyltransferase
VRLILAEAAYVVERLLPPQSVSAYYIFFPDPWPKRRHHRRRLFSPEFMDSLHLSLAPGGHIHIATDHLDYFAGIRKTLIADARFVQIEALPPLEEERTDFEIAFTQQNMPIGRCSFRKA